MILENRMNSYTIISNGEIIEICENLGLPLVFCGSKDLVYQVPKKLRKNHFYIINLDSKGLGTHWTCLSTFEKYPIYFDSYGTICPPIIHQFVSDIGSGPLRATAVQEPSKYGRSEKSKDFQRRDFIANRPIKKLYIWDYQLQGVKQTWCGWICIMWLHFLFQGIKKKKPLVGDIYGRCPMKQIINEFLLLGFDLDKQEKNYNVVLNYMKKII
jgi:hypothetical protein